MMRFRKIFGITAALVAATSVANISASEHEQGSSSSASMVSETVSSVQGVSNGGRRGQSTNVLIAMIDFLQGISENDQKLICSLRTALQRLEPGDPDDVEAFLAGYLADLLQKPDHVILAMFEDPSLCESTARNSVVPVAEKLRPFWIAEDGLPYSFMNPFWNDCIRGQVFTKAQILANPDVGPRGHLTCGDYYTIADGVAYWRRPGINNGEQALFQYDSRTKTFTVMSEGYYIAYSSSAIAKKHTIPVTVVSERKSVL